MFHAYVYGNLLQFSGRSASRRCRTELTWTWCAKSALWITIGCRVIRGVKYVRVIGSEYRRPKYRSSASATADRELTAWLALGRFIDARAMHGEASLARYSVWDVAVERFLAFLVTPSERVQVRLRLQVHKHSSSSALRSSSLINCNSDPHTILHVQTILRKIRRA